MHVHQAALDSEPTDHMKSVTQNAALTLSGSIPSILPPCIMRADPLSFGQHDSGQRDVQMSRTVHGGTFLSSDHIRQGA